MITKKELGINGDHDELGREMKMYEFRGYVTATLKGIDEKFDILDGRYGTLKKDVEFNKKLLYVGIGAVAAIELFLNYVV